jgi:hypothetical protein
MCSGLPYPGKSTLRGKVFYDVSFQTRQLECLNELHGLFYLHDSVTLQYKKVITDRLYDYFTYATLAHWIQGDGSKFGKGIVLSTQSFTLQENVTLMNILMIKFDISSSLQRDKGGHKYRLYISGKTLNTIRPHILPYFSPHFLYKINPSIPVDNTHL